MKPGMTGWAQVNGLRGETQTVEQMRARVQYDLSYIDNWSLWFDAKIMFLTLFVGFVSKRASFGFCFNNAWAFAIAVERVSRRRFSSAGLTASLDSLVPNEDLPEKLSMLSFCWSYVILSQIEAARAFQ